MQYHHTFIAALSITLFGCTTVTNIDDGSNVGLDIQEVEPVQQEETMHKEESEESAFDIDALHESYAAANTVKDIMFDVSAGMDSEARKALAPALEVFANDIEALKYYVDISNYEDLTDEETIALITLMADIDSAMTVFDDILALAS